METNSVAAEQVKFLQLDRSVGKGKNFRRPVTETEAEINDKKLKRACQDFESIFLYYLLKTMRESIPKSGYLEGGIGQGVFQEMIDEKLAQKMSKIGRMGISEMLYRDLSKRGMINEHKEDPGGR